MSWHSFIDYTRVQVFADYTQVWILMYMCVLFFWHFVDCALKIVLQIDKVYHYYYKKNRTLDTNFILQCIYASNVRQYNIMKCMYLCSL